MTRHRRLAGFHMVSRHVSVTELYLQTVTALPTCSSSAVRPALSLVLHARTQVSHTETGRCKSTPFGEEGGGGRGWG